MKKYDDTISENSVWITVTPTPLTQKFPFYITEAGHFEANRNYAVKRELHDSFLLIYTRSGQGCVKTGETSILLPREHAIIIDCHIPHEYFAQSDTWDFLWIHFYGTGVNALFDIIYPNTSVHAVNMKNAHNFENMVSALINNVTKSDIKSCIDVSSQMHTLLNSVHSATLELEENNQKKDSADDIRTVIEFIEDKYSEPISIDDMVNTIHISKYHFIRRFRRTMGITPYHYLTNYRITVAKTLLRSSNRTVAEIAEDCGFLDTSNFITQFKKRTGQKPLQYRRDFT